MWILLAFGSALFAGLTSILAKVGIKHTDSDLATAIRTGVVLFFSWIMVFIVGSQGTLVEIGPRTMFFLIASGLATGASWLCYYRALQVGDVNRVVPIDKSSIVLTIALAFIILREPAGLWRIVGAVLIAAGTLLMALRKPAVQGEKRDIRWAVYAVLSAVFASLTAIFGKLGIEGVESNLGTAVRTGVVLIMAWGMVFVKGQAKKAFAVPRRELIFILLSGAATGASWLCYYRALQLGPASGVVPIDKLSILVTIAFSRFALGEKLSPRALVGLAAIVAGTLAMLI